MATSDDQSEATDAPAQSGGTREVVVPLRVYKTVAVFTTLFAVVSVVVGFMVLDAATARGTAPINAVNPVTALVGVGLILLGAGIYAFSTRFRTDGMGSETGADDAPADEDYSMNISNETDSKYTERDN